MEGLVSLELGNRSHRAPLSCDLYKLVFLTLKTAYFPIPTLHKLRLTLVFYGVFQLFSSILIFLIVSLFFAFMDKRCSIMPYSYQSFFRFTSVRWEILYAFKNLLFSDENRKLAEKWICKRTSFCRTLGSIICGVFVCGYFLPFCNSKGLCFPIKLIVSYPLFQITVLICPIVSFFTGGQDQMCLDWNLVVIPCSASLTSRSTYGKRPFVESESFRYAQHTNDFKRIGFCVTESIDVLNSGR
ncbi:unnamed protein product [Angiostrongylus costaricensis]|uniref:Uncharacterized protein n=1 Tax=Angiostrongylus costaricensis TaxID=334426 RepID=A0A0R3PWS1_ANGCS|nr:unnamed protein product [Angiostrongylus costaricensis]